MNLKKYILSSLYFPSRFLNFIRSLTANRTRIRVILFHDVPVDSYDKFNKIISFLEKDWKFITAEDFANHLNGNKKLIGDNLLLSFDDGFYSNRLVAEKILEPKGIKAIFFVVTDFVNIENQQGQTKFIKDNLYPKWRNHALPENYKSMKSLSVKDLKYLIDKGHTIGCHTASHQDLSKIENLEQLNHEIIASADFLEKELETPIEHFSFGFGNVSFFSKLALSVAMKRFPYIYTGMRGDNAECDNLWAIRRDTISLDDSLMVAGSFLEGIADFRYKDGFKIYESWVYESDAN